MDNPPQSKRQLMSPASPTNLDNSKNPLSKANNVILVNNFLNLIRSPSLKVLKMASAVPSSSKNVSDLKMPIKTAVNSGNFLFANQLKQKGFCIAPALIFESIYKKDVGMINNIINHSLYSRLNTDLAFWFLLKNGYTAEAKTLWEKETEIQNYCDNQTFNQPELVQGLLNRPDLMETAFDQALLYGVDEAACLLTRMNYKLLSIDRITKALESGCVNLLKIVWSGDLETEPELILGQKSESEIWSYLNTYFSNVEEVENMRTFMKASCLIEHYLQLERYNEVKKIISWSMLRNSLKILNLLIESNNPDLTKEYILNSGIEVTSGQFVLALLNNKFDVCYTMLRVYRLSLEIRDRNLHRQLITMIESPSTCLLAIEILNRIKLQYWTLEYTRDLCLTLSTFIKKKHEIVYCPGPMLFCVLVLELMKKISKFSNKYTARCNNTAEIYTNFGISLESCLADEETLKHFMTQKDSLGRTVLEIIAKREMYQLLEDDNVGVLVSKLWVGSESYYSVYHASSIVTTILAPSGSEESLQFTRGVDMTKPYSFQLIYLKDSCATRIFSLGFAILFLVILYQVMLYLMISSGTVLEMKSGSIETKLFGIIVTLIFGISCEQILNIIYNLKTRGKINIDMWKINDWIIGLLVVFISAEIPLKAYKNNWVEYESAYLGSGIIHGIMIALICMKFGNILLTTKSIGPFISMTLLIFREIYSFFIIFLGINLCSSAIFTLLFQSTPGYEKLDLSFRTLYMATIGPYVIDNFKDNRLAFGAVVLSIFLLISHILILNLLVGIVTNVFTIFQQRIESEHRSVVITRYYENRWSDDCGVLILLPTPINALSLLFSPLILCGNSKKWNRILSNAFFFLYTIPHFILFVIVTGLAIPVAFLEGFWIRGRMGSEVPEQAPIKIFDIPDENVEPQLIRKFSYFKLFSWTFIGIPWLVIAFLRDCYQFWILAYLNSTPSQVQNPALIDQVFIKNFQKIINQSQVDITTSDFYNSFKKLDEAVFPDSTEERNEEIRLIITQFSHPDLNGKIDCAKIKSLFPRVTGGNYDESYIDRFTYFRLPYIVKGVKAFQRTTGTIAKLRKNRGQQKEHSVKFFAELENVEESVNRLKEKINILSEECSQLSGGVNENDDLLEM